jgi:hypothetical protein
MSQTDIAVIATTIAAQTVAALVMSLLLFGFNRQYEKSYLTHWALGWMALALHHITIAINLVLFARLGWAPEQPLRASISIAGSACAYMEVGWLVFGVYELIRRRPVRLVHARRILLILGVSGALVTALLIASGDSNADSAIGFLGAKGSASAFSAWPFSSTAVNRFTMSSARRFR